MPVADYLRIDLNPVGYVQCDRSTGQLNIAVVLARSDGWRDLECHSERPGSASSDR